jgi:shikimate dehydrogenase
MLGDYSYELFEKEPEELETFLKRGQWDGLNVTVPYKKAVIPFLDELTPIAQRLGAVNTIVRRDGKLIGHNTDGVGYMRSVIDAGHDIIGKEMTLLGSGGASSAILAQAALDGVTKIQLFARKGNSWDIIQKQVDHINKDTSCHVFLNELSDTTTLKASMKDSAILVNASSVGMSPNTDACLIPDCSYFHPELVVSDVIYNPKKTALLHLAESAGLSTFNGMYMLLYQGAEAFRIWTGKEMPVDLVKKQLFSN